MITREELIEKYLKFFESKNHKVIPSSSLIPENDPTVLFTTAGMHPLVPFLLGQPHPLGKRLCDVQKCIRTGDIDEVGDQTHHTFFEMLGNWSLGDYFKEDAIKYSFEFLTKILKIPIEKLAISCFEGNSNAPKDNEAKEAWLKRGIPEKRIAFLDKHENWWETPSPGPCGPDTEIFYWTAKEKAPEEFDPKNKSWVEIGNDVLIQYEKDKNNNYTEAKQKNIDFGGGVERILAVLNGYKDNYQTPVWQPLIKEIEKLSKKTYQKNKTETRAMRIIADHLKASVMIISDGVSPSNSKQGYVLRRLIRRAVRYSKILNLNQKNDLTTPLAKATIEIYKNTYPELEINKEKIINELKEEKEKFEKTLEKGLKEFKKITSTSNQITGVEAFLLYQSYGFPIEMTRELAQEKNIQIDEKEFEEEYEKHQKLSQTASAGMFKSGLQDNSEKTTKLHTATHLLLASLKVILKDENIEQKGSNITPERLRFDFTYPRKLTKEELKKIEDLVNAQIEQGIKITKEEMPPKIAKEKGATGIFNAKYPEIVSVYTMGNFSKEICTGPHVENTKNMGKFKIKKEESSSSGVRRIKAILE